MTDRPEEPAIQQLLDAIQANLDRLPPSWRKAAIEQMEERVAATTGQPEPQSREGTQLTLQQVARQIVEAAAVGHIHTPHPCLLCIDTAHNVMARNLRPADHGAVASRERARRIVEGCAHAEMTSSTGVKMRLFACQACIAAVLTDR